ncbi:MAG TPA: hypothetical protein PLC79_01355 [Phycisphaerae bacterium]|nr:hypothetical protein [Phycisphaerae bacterium]
MALFKSSEERRIERDIRIRQGIRRIEKAIREQARFQDEFVKNAQRARQMGDAAQYQFIRNSLKKTAAIRKMLERQLLAVKNALLIKRQAEASADFTKAMGTMAVEIGKLFGETDLVKTQADWEKAMARSQSMEERMSMFLDSVEDLAAQDVSAAPSEAISDEEIDRLIEAEADAAQAQEVQKLEELRAELASLKGQTEKQK